MANIILSLEMKDMIDEKGKMYDGKSDNFDCR